MPKKERTKQKKVKNKRSTKIRKFEFRDVYCYIWLGLGKAAGNAGLEQESKEGQEVHLRQRIRTGVHKPGNIRGNY